MAFNRELFPISQQTPHDINQKNVYDLIEKRQTILYKGFREIFEAREELAQYRIFQKENGDFWDRRNKTMARNIITFATSDLFRNKTIVVLTGFYHKYYLLNELLPQQQKCGYIIQEYYEAKR
jgi:hypothetical protein